MMWKAKIGAVGTIMEGHRPHELFAGTVAVGRTPVTARLARHRLLRAVIGGTRML